MKKPTQRDLHRGRLRGRRHRVKRCRLRRSKSAQRKERHVGYALHQEFVNEPVIRPLRDVVMVLDAYDLCYFVRVT